MQTISLWDALRQPESAQSRSQMGLALLPLPPGLVLLPASLAGNTLVETFGSWGNRSVLLLSADDDVAGQEAAAMSVIESGGLILTAAAGLDWLTSAGLPGEPQHLVAGSEQPLTALCAWLESAGYTHQYQVETPGEWSKRGGVVDLWPPGRSSPVRLDYWGDEIERIRLFDAATQLSFGETAEVVAAPVLAQAGSLWEWLGNYGRWVLGRETVLNDWRAGHEEDWQGWVLDARKTLAGFDDFPWNTEAPLLEPLLLPAAVGGASRWPLEPRFLHLRRLRDQGRTLLISARSHRHRKALQLLAEPYNLSIESVTELPETLPEDSRGRVLCVVGARLPSLLVGSRVALIDEGTLVGSVAASRPQVLRKSVLQVEKLAAGSLVVHREYGLGRFVRLQRRTLDGQLQEFLELQYRGNDKVLLPVDRIDLLEPFVAEDEERKLEKLGSKRYQTQRRKASEDAARFAADLLQREAGRHAALPLPMTPPGEISAAVEAGFPYTLTSDQGDAVEDLLHDMVQGETPADRLLVGDVGFGKTEVALRGMVLTVENGYQAVMLAPTTILAYQHYRLFAERLQDTGMIVSYVNRFRSAKENRDTLRAAASGQVDILIGTHRLLQRDLHLPKLGLLVVDEEHKFGVKQKEQIAAINRRAHRLSMSATPIPRSLHQALGGLRDTSTIATPPPSRQSVETQVIPLDTDIMQGIIQRELARKGQTFVVVPRIAGLEDAADMLRDLLPDARIGVGHGQLSGHDMEELFLQFLEGKIDVLVSTNIVESGLDVANANTMLVLNAHLFGLADLYQLRGRVGRSERKGYCALVVPRAARLTSQATARLDAIERFVRLGSGYQVALYDLEIRGAGDLLGREQSGHIKSIGMAAYSRLLEEALAEARGEAAPLREPELRFGFSTALPEDLPLGDEERLEIYRLLYCAASNTDFSARAIEIQDRFHLAEENLDPLRYVAVCRGYARQLGISSLDWALRGATLVFDPASTVDRALLVALVSESDSYALTPEAFGITWAQETSVAQQWEVLLPVLARLASPA